MITIVVDVETTGLLQPSVADIAKQPRIIELAVARIDRGSVVAERSWLISPGEPLSAEIVKITGITDEMLKGKPNFAAVLPDIKQAFAGADMLVAHNAPFDTGCLTYELRRAACDDFPWPPETMCTVQEYVHEFGYRPKLTELYFKKIGKELKQEHRALGDVMALVEILFKEKLL